MIDTKLSPDRVALGDEDVPTFIFGGKIPAGSESQFYGENESRIPTRATTAFINEPFVSNQDRI